MKLKFRNLKASEIKPAIAKVNSEGVTILLWKNNFVDLDILDEALEPTDYQVTFPRENVCKISIWDKLKKVWVEREGIGEGISAKCTANDSLKRAGMSWGIGRELFTSGELFIPKHLLKNWKSTAEQYKCYDEFKVLEIQYFESTRIISSLKLGILYHGELYNEISFSFDEPVDKTDTKVTKKSTRSSTKNEKTAKDETIEPSAVESNDNSSEAQEPVSLKEATESKEEEPSESKKCDDKDTVCEADNNKNDEQPNSLIADSEVILIGNCRGKSYGEVKDSETFKSFLNWAKKASPRYNDEAAANQFLRFKKLANIPA